MKATEATIAAGAAIAATLSWSVNGSFVWAIMHGATGWIYILYWLMKN